MNKLAIIGFADSSRNLAPFNNPEFELWGINDLHTILPPAQNITRWFDIHSIEQLREMKTRNETLPYIPELNKLEIPIMMQQSFDEVPRSIPYPLEEILSKFRRYFSNSISWMLALAIHEGYKEIHVYGVDMAHGTEYAEQKPSCEYFLGYAEGAGIKIHIPDESDLLKYPYLYGFEEPKISMMEKKLQGRKLEVHKRIHGIEANIAGILINSGRMDLVQAFYSLNGVLEDTEYMQKEWI